MATGVVPPPEMRERVLATASLTRQLPPSGSRLRSLAAPRGSARLRRPAITVTVAAMAAAIVVLAVLLAGTRHELRLAQDVNGAVAAVLAARRARRDGSAVRGRDRDRRHLLA